VFGRTQQPRLVADRVVQIGTDLVHWFLVESDGRVVVVDGGLPPYRPQLEPGLALLGRSRTDIEAIVLTHGHGDHIGVVEPLRRELGVPVHVHAGDEQLATTGGKVAGTEAPTWRYLHHPHAWRLLGHFKTSGKPEPVQHVETFADGALLPGGMRAIHTGGHTPGHTVLLLEERGPLFAGDLLTTSNPLTGGRGPELLARGLNQSTAGMLESLSKLERLDAGTVLFAHGEPWTQGIGAAVRRAREIGPT
jgi:glyoxylase-like metal-dependent hydrolase (beta-lactamase superfamily II)